MVYNAPCIINILIIQAIARFTIVRPLLHASCVLNRADIGMPDMNFGQKLNRQNSTQGQIRVVSTFQICLTLRLLKITSLHVSKTLFSFQTVIS